MRFLLRKIRKALLSKGSISSFIIYAMGEIILVVVGILIAVNIDNWNQNQKQEKADMAFYQKMLGQALNDSVYYDSRISICQKLITHWDFILDRKEVFASPMPVSSYNGFMMRMTFYSTLMDANEGLLDRIKDPIIEDKAREYLRLYEFCTEAQELLNDYNFQSDFFYKTHFPELVMTEFSDWAGWKKEVQSDAQLQALATGSARLIFNIQMQVENIRESNTQLIQILRQKLKPRS